MRERLTALVDQSDDSKAQAAGVVIQDQTRSLRFMLTFVMYDKVT